MFRFGFAALSIYMCGAGNKFQSEAETKKKVSGAKVLSEARFTLARLYNEIFSQNT